MTHPLFVISILMIVVAVGVMLAAMFVSMSAMRHTIDGLRASNDHLARVAGARSTGEAVSLEHAVRAGGREDVDTSGRDPLTRLFPESRIEAV